MSSGKYKMIVRHRLNYPETIFPEYTCINHSKIDFVKYTIENIVSSYMSSIHKDY